MAIDARHNVNPDTGHTPKRSGRSTTTEASASMPTTSPRASSSRVNQQRPQARSVRRRCRRGGSRRDDAAGAHRLELESGCGMVASAARVGGARIDPCLQAPAAKVWPAVRVAERPAVPSRRPAGTCTIPCSSSMCSPTTRRPLSRVMSTLAAVVAARLVGTHTVNTATVTVTSAVVGPIHEDGTTPPVTVARHRSSLRLDAHLTEPVGPPRGTKPNLDPP